MSECEIAEAVTVDAQTLTPLKNKPLRVCRVCGLEALTETDLNLFVKNINRCKYNREKICKTCRAKYQQKYYQENKTKIDKRTNAYQKKHKTKLREYHKKYRQENRTRLNKYNKKRRATPEQKEKRKEQRNKNKLTMREWQFLYSGRKKQKSDPLTPQNERRRQKSGYLMGDGCCMWPNCHNTNPFVLQNHHPWKKDDPDFTITLCANHHEYFTRNRSVIIGFFKSSHKP